MSKKIDFQLNIELGSMSAYSLKHLLKKRKEQVYIIDELKQCIENNLDIEESNEYGNSFLQETVWNNMLEEAELLLNNGANQNFFNKDEHGNSILHEACYLGNIDMVRLLIKYKADTKLKNKHGETPLDFATKFYKNKPDEAGKKIITLLKRCEE